MNLQKLSSEHSSHLHFNQIIHKTVKRPSTRSGLLEVFTGGGGARKQTLPGASRHCSLLYVILPRLQSREVPAHTGGVKLTGESGENRLYLCNYGEALWGSHRSGWVTHDPVSTTLLRFHCCTGQLWAQLLLWPATALSCSPSWPGAEVLALPLLIETRGQCYCLPGLHQYLPTHFVLFFCAPWGRTLHTDRDVD